LVEGASCYRTVSVLMDEKRNENPQPRGIVLVYLALFLGSVHSINIWMHRELHSCYPGILSHSWYSAYLKNI